MKILAAVLGLGLFLALSAGLMFGIVAHKQRQTQLALQEELRARAAESETRAQLLDQNAKRLERQLSILRDELSAVKRRGTEREDELTALRGKNGELERQVATENERVKYIAELNKLPRFDTAAQILGLPACTLTDAQNHICSEGFKDADGKDFYIGGPGASREVAGFIRSLKNGETISLPKSFIEYQKKKEVFETAAQLLAIKPRTAEAVDLEDGQVLFRTKSGEMFQVGGEHVSPEVNGFLKTLEEGNSYTLPESFVEYQKKRAQNAQPAEATPANGGK